MRSWRRTAGIAAAAQLAAAATVGAVARPGRPPGTAGCERAARRYEQRCLMPRIEARVRLAVDVDAPAFVDGMARIEAACAEATAAGLVGCPEWPRVRPTAEYRRWLREVREGWQRQQAERDGGRPACPPGARHCL